MIRCVRLSTADVFKRRSEQQSGLKRGANGAQISSKYRILDTVSFGSFRLPPLHQILDNQNLLLLRNEFGDVILHGKFKVPRNDDEQKV